MAYMPGADHSGKVARLFWPVMGAAVLVPALVAGVRLGWAGRFDFSFFYGDARHLLTGGDLTQCRYLEWYLPGMRVALMWLALLPRWLGVLVWNGMNLLAAGAVLAAMVQLARTLVWPDNGHEGARRVSAVGLACLLVAPIVLNIFQINQISFWPMAFMLWGHLFAIRRRDGVAGILLGLAVFIKLLPGLLIGWCLLRRRWRMAACAAALPVLLSPAIDAAVFGPAQAWRHHVHWFEVTVNGSTGTGFVEHGTELYHKNQGLAVVLTRLLRPTPTFYSRPLPMNAARQVKQVNIATVSEHAVKQIYRAVVGISAIALVMVTWRLGRRATLITEHGLFAIWCVALMWFAPLMRPYYMVWALPALWLLIEVPRHYPDQRAVVIAGRVGISAWLVGLVGWAIPEARAIGINQWVNLTMVVMLVWMLRQIGHQLRVTSS